MKTFYIDNNPILYGVNSKDEATRLAVNLADAIEKRFNVETEIRTTVPDSMNAATDPNREIQQWINDNWDEIYE